MGLLITNEFERIWKEVVPVKSKYYPRISLERLRKDMKYLRKYSRPIFELTAPPLQKNTII
jgi:hypothetical protein